ncbi:SDR family oxidoreductase [Nesterenkonia haasae]|uniref:SDR family oxidoreductase n=1 Tax=Nesterenkonia haasae TaxID=2587813 RepID=UPI0038B2B023
MREIRRKNVALQSEGDTREIASPAFFLSTDQARWITGQVLSVDGGGFTLCHTGAAEEGTVTQGLISLQ